MRIADITRSVVDSLDPLAARIVATGKHTVVIEYEGAREKMPRYVRDMLALAAYAEGQGVDVVGRDDFLKSSAPDLGGGLVMIDRVQVSNEWLMQGKEDLKAACRYYGLKVSGHKLELAERLADAGREYEAWRRTH